MGRHIGVLLHTRSSLVHWHCLLHGVRARKTYNLHAAATRTHSPRPSHRRTSWCPRTRPHLGSDRIAVASGGSKRGGAAGQCPVRSVIPLPHSHQPRRLLFLLEGRFFLLSSASPLPSCVNPHVRAPPSPVPSTPSACCWAPKHAVCPTWQKRRSRPSSSTDRLLRCASHTPCRWKYQLRCGKGAGTAERVAVLEVRE